MNKALKSFWITNISNRDVMLYDLNYTIPALSSVNLMSNNFNYSQEYLEKSLKQGSLFIKKDKVVKRKLPPERQICKIEVDRSPAIPSKRVVNMEPIKEIDELRFNDFSDDDKKEIEFQKELEILEG